MEINVFDESYRIDQERDDRLAAAQQHRAQCPNQRHQYIQILLHDDEYRVGDLQQCADVGLHQAQQALLRG